MAQGFGIGAGLIIAIGAQNAFVLRQGLRREHVPLAVALCTVCDSFLIVLGAVGLGTMIAQSPILQTVAVWGGAAFLIGYGAFAFRNALRPGALVVSKKERAISGTKGVVAAALGFSILNPHAWLDTVVMLGGIAGQFPGIERTAFTTGAVLASLAWFVALGFGATRLAPLFARPAAWRVLDLLVAAMLWTIAASLIMPRLS